MKSRGMLSVVVALLLISAAGSWGWYFATQPAEFGRMTDAGMARASTPRRAAPMVSWRAATAEERTAAVAIIKAQLEAFKKNDYQRAVQFQSSGLRRNFQSIEAFRQMMKTAYPQFASYQKATFGPARAAKNGKMLEVPIILTGRDKVEVRAIYMMQLENGAYRVASVGGGAPVRGGCQHGHGHGHGEPQAPPGMEKAESLLS